jgi:hypothetical protein
MRETVACAIDHFFIQSQYDPEADAFCENRAPLSNFDGRKPSCGFEPNEIPIALHERQTRRKDHLGLFESG